MLHKKSIIFALFHKYTVCFAWVAAWVEKQTVFFVRQTVWKVLFVGENSAVSLVCASGCVLFFAGCPVCFFEFLPRFGWHCGVEKARRSLFLCLKMRVHCE